MDDWQNAQSLEDLCRLTVRWLDGELAHHCVQNGPPDPETRRIRRRLRGFNELGYCTAFSQPAEKVRNGFGQRAAVSGFCAEPAARRLAALSLCSELIVFAFPPGNSGGYSVPVTLEEFHPFTWCGRFDSNTLDEFHGVGQGAKDALSASWYVVLIDPCWGRPLYLWRRAKNALKVGLAPYDVAPAQGLRLDCDFIW